MKALACILFALLLVLPLAAEDPTGLYLRAVVEEGTDGATEMKTEEGLSCFIAPDAILTPDDVASATVVERDGISILFEFTPTGQEKLGKATLDLVGKQLAIIIDGKLISTPMVQEPFSKSAIVTGDFTREWAESVVQGVPDRPN